MRALGLLSILIWTIAISNGYPLAGEVAHEDEEIAIPYNEEASGTVPTFEEELEIVENIIIAPSRPQEVRLHDPPSSAPKTLISSRVSERLFA
ncbi:unnamed protein product, partial [Mesorhabditis spiculigera]